MSAETGGRASAVHPLPGDGRGPRAWQRSTWAAVSLALVVGLVAGGAGWELLRSDPQASSTGAAESRAANRKTAQEALSHWTSITPVTTSEEVADMAAREASLYAEDGVWVDAVMGDVGRGRDEIAALTRSSITPGVTHFVEGRILLVWSTGAAVSWTWGGTPFGEVSGVDIYEMKDGVITRATTFYEL